MSAPTRIVTLCTGNAARSVMMGFMLTRLSEVNNLEWEIRTAGTHATEGAAMSPRTLESLVALEDLGEHHFTSHRSHQLTTEDMQWADLVIAVEASHVAYVAAHHPDHSHKAIQLRHFVRYAPLDEDFVTQREAVSQYALTTDFDVEDPAGGDQGVYHSCARELWDLSHAFVTVLASSSDEN